MARLEFPEGFHWGATTAATSVEGAVAIDGRGESIWDRFASRPGRIADGTTPARAASSYHHTKDDVALLRAMQCTSHRFSIAWPRIQPDGRGAFERAGLDHYGRFVDALLAAGIRPLPTLYHWDLPQALDARGGWADRDTAWRFAEYANEVARELGDRVRDWILFDDPASFVRLGHAIGLHAPGRSGSDDALRAGHHVNLAQGEGLRAVRDGCPEARIGTAISWALVEPEGDSEDEALAAERAHAFQNDWYLAPALRGAYPQAFWQGLPEARMGIREGDLERARAAFDFVGLDLATPLVSHFDPHDPLGLGVNVASAKRGSGVTDDGSAIHPASLYDAAMRITRDYDEIAIEVTSCGGAFDDEPDDEGVVHDVRRIDFHRAHLAALHRAIEDGADVRSHHARSLIDGFEWTSGLAHRFGLAWVDFETAARRLKQSGLWYAEVAAEGGFDPEAEGTGVT